MASHASNSIFATISIRAKCLRMQGGALLGMMLLLGVRLASIAAHAQETEDVERITVFENVHLDWKPDAPASRPKDPYIIRHKGQEVERTITLPSAPENLRNARRIIATVHVKPRVTEVDDQPRIGDPWTRLAHVKVVMPGENPQAAEREVEIMRFVTGFGGESSFETDVTAYAPLLHGHSTLRLSIGTWLTPGWDVSMSLSYRAGEAGYRRPVYVEPLVTQRMFTRGQSSHTAQLTIPKGLSLPRLHLYSTGHGGLQEFASATHVVKIDGREVLRFRPWREDGGTLHAINPTSERFEIDGRTLWSSDLDRAGWIPGDVVHRLAVPLPELTPGQHTVTLEIGGIRTPDAEEADPLDGPFWTVSATVVADEPWPTPKQEGNTPESAASPDQEQTRQQQQQVNEQ